MEILDDILAELQATKKEVVSLKANLKDALSRPIPVPTINTREINDCVKSCFSNVQLEITKANENISKVVTKIPTEIKVQKNEEEVFGFTTLKSAILFLGVFTLIILGLSFWAIWEQRAAADAIAEKNTAVERWTRWEEAFDKVEKTDSKISERFIKIATSKK